MKRVVARHIRHTNTCSSTISHLLLCFCFLAHMFCILIMAMCLNKTKRLHPDKTRHSCPFSQLTGMTSKHGAGSLELVESLTVLSRTHKELRDTASTFPFIHSPLASDRCNPSSSNLSNFPPTTPSSTPDPFSLPWNPLDVHLQEGWTKHIRTKTKLNKTKQNHSQSGSFRQFCEAVCFQPKHGQEHQPCKCMRPSCWWVLGTN